MRAPAAWLLSAAGLLSACAGMTRYPDSGEKNLYIHADASSGSAFSSVRAVLGVHAVDQRCRVTYEGSVKLDRQLIQVGIPADRLSYLVFEFASSSFLGGMRGSVTHETLLRPRPGLAYDIRVSYRDDIYNVVIREREPPGREISRVGLAACRQQARAAYLGNRLLAGPA